MGIVFAFGSPRVMQAAALRSQVESTLGIKFSTSLILQELSPVEWVPSGFRELDTLTGGLPRGGLTEISGPVSSGRTSLGLSVLAQRTANGEVCAWVDVGDSFDPNSAKTAGVTLQRLLWVRCCDLERAIQAADLVLGGGGFGLVVLDLGSVSLRTLRRLPLSFWFRFRRAVEHTPTLLLVLTPQASAKSCASLRLQLRLDKVNWSTIANTRLLSHFRLFQGSRFCAEVSRSRLRMSSEAASQICLMTGINYRAHLSEA